ncbi:PHD-type domain-containing protein [Entamoeba marina]
MCLSPLQSDKIPEKEWYCTACSYREGLIKLDIPQTDPLYDFHKHLTTTNPLQYDTTKYTRDLCEYCEQKGVHVKCAHVGCSRAFHLQCHDPPLFTIPQVFYCDLHVPKKDKEVKFLRPTSFVYVHDNDVDSKLLSPLIPIVKLQENLNK